MLGKIADCPVTVFIDFWSILKNFIVWLNSVKMSSDKVDKYCISKIVVVVPRAGVERLFICIFTLLVINEN